MSKVKKVFFRNVLKGVWSPFFRRRIKMELESHLEDISINKELSEEEALKNLGDSTEMNSLYKRLFYKKLKNDFYIFGSISTIFLGATIYYISGQVDSYITWSQGEYKKIQKGYLYEMEKLHTFNRSDESENAAKYLRDVLTRLDKEIPTNVFSELEKFNYWNNLALLPSGIKQYHYKMPQVHVREMTRLVRASYRNIEESEDKKIAKRQHKHLAKLIYSTETMAGFRIAQNMIAETVYKENGRLNFYGGSKANRVSGMTWSLMNIQPTLVMLEEDIRDKNYYQIGLCHHAEEVWFNDVIYKDFMKSGWPLEKERTDELIALRKIKEKLKKDCRLSFLNYAKEPESMSAFDIVTGSNNLFKGALGSGLNAYVPEGLVTLFGHVPYLRALAGRYIVWKTSTTDYEARDYYRNFEG